jgi:porin
MLAFNRRVYSPGGKGAPLSIGSKHRLSAWLAGLALLPGGMPAGGQEARSVQPALIYEAEGVADVAGGARRGATYLGNLNLQLTFDLARLAGWRDTTVFLSGLGIHGGHPSEFAGDAQGVSSIEGPRKWTLEEAWIEKNFHGNRFSVLLGRYDLNSELYHLHAADLFLNSSFGIGPELSQSGQGGPSIYPNTSVGGRFAVKPVEGIVIRGAVLDGVPVERPTGREVFAKGDGLLLVSEVAFLSRPAQQGERRRPHRFRLGREAQLPPYDEKLAAGVWHYTARFPDLSRTRDDGTLVTHRGSSGAYVIGDAVVYKGSGGRELRVVGQAGAGDSRSDRFGWYTGGGLDLAGAIPGRADDEIGIALAMARNGNPYIEQQERMGQPAGRAETAVELAYLAQVTSWLHVQPDVQYVFRPNTDPRVRDALVTLLRVELSF